MKVRVELECKCKGDTPLIRIVDATDGILVSTITLTANSVGSLDAHFSTFAWRSPGGEPFLTLCRASKVLTRVLTVYPNPTYSNLKHYAPFEMDV